MNLYNKIIHLKCASNFISAYVFNLLAFPTLDCLILESLLLFKYYFFPVLFPWLKLSWVFSLLSDDYISTQNKTKKFWMKSLPSFHILKYVWRLSILSKAFPLFHEYFTFLFLSITMGIFLFAFHLFSIFEIYYMILLLYIAKK